MRFVVFQTPWAPWLCHAGDVATPPCVRQALRPLLALLALAIVTLVSGGTAAASTAASFSLAQAEALHDSAHSATASVTGPATGRVEWTRSLGGNITPGPVRLPQTTPSTSRRMPGCSMRSTPRQARTSGPLAAPARIRGNRSVDQPLGPAAGFDPVAGPADTLYELSPAGQLLWSHRFDGMVLSPALAGTTVYVGLMSGTVWELNVSGTLPALGWSTSIGHSSFGSPAVGPDGDVIATADRSVMALAGATGTVQWRYHASATIEVSPSVGATGDVYISANDASVYELRPDGSLAWHRHIGQESYSSSSVTNGLLYFGDNSGALNVVRSASGTLVRTDRGVKGLWAAQAIDHKGDVYFGTQGKGIYGYTAAGRQIFHLRASGAFDSYPALSADGTLLIGGRGGDPFAIG